MNCHNIEEQLTSWLLGDLPAEEAAAIDTHVQQCDACRAAAREIEPTLDLLRAALAEPSPAPEHLSGAHRRRIAAFGIADEEAASPRERLGWLARPHPQLAAMAALLLVGFFVVSALLMPAMSRVRRAGPMVLSMSSGDAVDVSGRHAVDLFSSVEDEPGWGVAGGMAPSDSAVQHFEYRGGALGEQAEVVTVSGVAATPGEAAAKATTSDLGTELFFADEVVQDRGRGKKLDYDGDGLDKGLDSISGPANLSGLDAPRNDGSRIAGQPDPVDSRGLETKSGRPVTAQYWADLSGNDVTIIDGEAESSPRRRESVAADGFKLGAIELTGPDNGRDTSRDGQAGAQAPDAPREVDMLVRNTTTKGDAYKWSWEDAREAGKAGTLGERPADVPPAPGNTLHLEKALGDDDAVDLDESRLKRARKGANDRVASRELRQASMTDNRDSYAIAATREANDLLAEPVVAKPTHGGKKREETVRLKDVEGRHKGDVVDESDSIPGEKEAADESGEVLRRDRQLSRGPLLAESKTFEAGNEQKATVDKKVQLPSLDLEEHAVEPVEDEEQKQSKRHALTPQLEPLPPMKNRRSKQKMEEDDEGGSGPRFQAHGVNPFVVAAQNAFSTFAIDVDTASYTLARNYMRRGILPPAESVRTEEFVNFFDYQYPAPVADTFKVYVEAAPTPFGRGLKLLKIGVKGRRLGREEQRPAVLTFLIDTSGSMNQPDRLGLVRKSLTLLVSNLAAQDRVAIVQYDSHARLVLEHTPASRSAEIIAAIDSLQCAGSTNLEEGMRRAYELAARSFVSGAENRVLLLSDGVANLGTVTAADILDSVSGFRKQGITCSVFGFGMGSYDDTMLEALANKGDGTYAFIDSIDEARRVFVEDLAATLNTIATDVKIQVEFNPTQVKRYRQLGYENRQLRKQDFRNDAIDAGEVGSGKSVTALYEFDDEPQKSWVMPGVSAPVREHVAVVRVRYRRVDTGKVEEIERFITRRDVAQSFEDADSRFRLGACVAEFSEILRGSPFAAGSAFADVAAQLRPVSLELSLDSSVRELLRLVQVAPGMGRGDL